MPAIQAKRRRTVAINLLFWFQPLFVGMEEGGGDTFDKVSKRLTLWDQRGRREVEDVVEYHLALSITHPFAEKAKLQPTWAKLIRVLLSMEGEPPSKEDVRRYQQQQ